MRDEPHNWLSDDLADQPHQTSDAAAEERRIEEIVDDYLDGLRAGEASNRKAILASHPELAIVLERRLAFAELVFRRLDRQSTESAVVKGKVDGGIDQSAEEGQLDLHCPHCGQEIQVTQGEFDVVASLACGVCRSTFTLDLSATLPFNRRGSWKRIGRFEILEVLGRGGFGTVYKARDTELERVVAVKVPRAGFFPSAEERERFLREARHASRLQHPRIVQVYDIGETEGVPYIVAEYIDGVTLADLIVGPRLSFRESAELIAAAGAAVDFAHKNKVIHRDIKPSNILIDGNRQPFLTDFGLACHDEAEITITQDGEVLGTPAYMSPEQAAGDHNKVGAATDIYGLGVLLYVLLTGEPPFHGNKRMLLFQVMHDEPRLPRKLNDRIPRDLETIAVKAMAKEIHKRYPTARAMVDDLRRWLDGRPILARPVSSVHRTIRWCHRNPALASLCVTVLLLWVALAAGSTIWAVRERGLRRVVQEERNQKDAAQKIAEVRERESRHRLIRYYTSSGLRLIEEGELIKSLPWIVEALALEEDLPERALIHRMRFGATLAQCPKLLRLWTHGGRVRRVQFSPVSPGVARVVSAGDDGRVFVQNVGTNSVYQEWKHSDAVLFATFDSNGQRIASAGMDKTVQVWDLESGKRPLTLKHDHWVTHVAFSPNGEFVATASYDKTARIWNARTGDPLRQPVDHGKVVAMVEFSPDSSRLLTVSGRTRDFPGEVRLLHVANGELQAKLAHDSYIWYASFAPDGQRVVTCGEDGNVKIWDLSTGEVVTSLNHGAPVIKAFFRDEPHSLVSVSREGTIRSWDVATGDVASVIRHGATVTQHPVISPDGRLIATAGVDGATRVWWIDTAQLACPPLPHNDSVWSLSFAPDSRRLVTSSDDGTVKIWDIAPTVYASHIFRHPDEITCARYSPDESLIVTASQDGTARVWRTESGQPLTPPLDHDSSGVLDCAFSPDSQILVSVSADGSVRLWNTQDWSVVLRRQTSAVSRVEFNSRGDRFLTADSSGRVTLWSVRTAAPLRYVNHEDRVLDLAFSEDGDLFAVACRDGTAKLYRTDSLKLVGKPFHHDGMVSHCAFSPDRTSLVTASNDERATIWDLKSRQCKHLVHNAKVWSAEFDHTGEHLLTTDLSGNAVIWDLSRGGRRTLRHSDASVTYGEFSEDGLLVVTSMNKDTSSGHVWGSGALRVWDPVTGSPVTPPLRHRDRIASVEFSSDGRSVLSSSADGSARVWRLTVDDRPVEKLRRLAILLSNRLIDPSQDAVGVGSATLRSYFDDLRAEYPATFSCSTHEIATWDEHLAKTWEETDDKHPR